MSKTFTLFKNIVAPKGISQYDIYEIPTGGSAIVDISIDVNYTLDSSSGGSDPITINISVIVKKQNGSSGTIGSDSFKSGNLLKLDRCILESDDTLKISVNGIGVKSLNINVAIAGILQ